MITVPDEKWFLDQLGENWPGSVYVDDLYRANAAMFVEFIRFMEEQNKPKDMHDELIP